MASYQELEEPLKDVLREIKLDKDQVKESKHILMQVVQEKLIPSMRKNDKVFASCFTKLAYAGSVYNNLKIQELSEFDLNFIIKFDSALEFKLDPHVPGFVKIKFGPIPESNSDVSRKLAKWVTKDGYLKRNLFYQWFRGVVSKTINTVDDEFFYGYHVTVRDSGPACTLKIENLRTKKIICVDLVAVLQFPSDKWPPRPVLQLSDVKGLSKKDFKDRVWFAVPKVYNELESKRLEDIYWRMSFYEYEKDIILSLQNMKPLIKLMKKLRDVYGWHFLASYHLVTVFLLEYKAKNSRDQWGGQLGKIFMHMLTRLLEHLAMGKISFFWDTRCDFLDFVKDDTLRNAQHRIQRIINKINEAQGEKRTQVIYEIFKIDVPSVQLPSPRLESQNEQPCSEQQVKEAPNGWAVLGGIGVAAALFGALAIVVARKTKSNR